MDKSRFYDATLATKIPALRKQAGLTLEEMSSKFGYTKMNYSNKEKKGSFTMKEALIISKALTEALGREITVNDLY